MPVSAWSGALLSWDQELSALKSRLGPAFGRAELRQSAGAFIDGVLSGVARKTGWLLAERAGLDRPYRIQSLIGRSSWQADTLRDLVRAEVLAALGDSDGVLVVDETDFLKKGTHSVGVAKQDSGAAGQMENCQIGVFLAYASGHGQALIDRRLYLPEAWAFDAVRRQRAQVPEAVEFRSKPQIACDLIAVALDAGAPCAWVLVDAVCSSDSRVRDMLEARGQPYVLATSGYDRLRYLTADGPAPIDRDLSALAPRPEAWSRHAAAEGSKGIRLYDWARTALPWTGDDGFERWLLIRRSPHDPAADACFLAFARAGSELAELAGAASLRWTIEECFRQAKEELGLDHCEARSWHGWHRHMTLCMAAAAFLARLSAELRQTAWSRPNRRSNRNTRRRASADV